MNRKLNVIFILICVLLVLGTKAYSKPNVVFRPAAFPLPLLIEDVQTRSEIYMYVSAFEGDLVLSDSDATQGEVGFVNEQLKKVMNEDYNAFSENMDESIKVDSARMLLGELSSAARKEVPNKISRIYRWGNLDYVVLNSSIGKSKIFPMLITKSKNGYKTAYGLLLDPVVQNISFLSQAALSEPNMYVSCMNANTRFSVQFDSPRDALSHDGSGGPVEIRFNGCVVNSKLKLCGKNKGKHDKYNVGAYAALIMYFEKALQDLQDGDVQKYLAYCSAGSRDRLDIGDQKEKTQHKKHGDTEELSTIFVLDAGAVKFVFYRTYNDGPVFYKTIKQTGAQYEIVNENYRGEFDAILQSEPFRKFLRNIQ